MTTTTEAVHALAENVRVMMRALVLDGHATPVAERIVGVIVDAHEAKAGTKAETESEKKN